MGRRVVSSMVTSVGSHRGDFTSCPHCYHSMPAGDWDNAAVVLVLEPSCFKVGYVAVVSECVKCFEESWVHQSIDSFKWSGWSERWKERVEKFGAAVKLGALRDWAAGLCGRCDNLVSGVVDFGTYRHCSIGCGPVVRECDEFLELKVKNG